MIGRASVLVLVAAAVAAGPLACGASADDASDPERGEDEFAVKGGAGLSILPGLEASGGKPAVCLGFVDATDAELPALQQRAESLVTDTANRWNELLRDSPLWTVKGRIVPSFHVERRICPPGAPGLKVNVWTTAERFRADRCANPRWTCASTTDAKTQSIHLAPINRGAPQHPLRAFAVLHEYGHLLGLGDTYRMPGLLEFAGTQPPSVMNGGSQTLVEDDRRGLLVALRAEKTGLRSCDGFGVQVPTIVNAWTAMICDPSTVPVVDHGGPTPPPPATGVKVPLAGTWAIDGRDVVATSIAIREVSVADDRASFTIQSYENGAPTAATAVYRCDASGVCASARDARYRLLVSDPRTMRWTTPSTPAGVTLRLATAP